MSDVSAATHEIALDPLKCRAYGVCVGIAPDHFAMPKGAPKADLLKKGFTEEELEDLVEAAEECPAQAISFLPRGETSQGESS